MIHRQTVRLLGIDFFIGPLADAVEQVIGARVAPERTVLNSAWGPQAGGGLESRCLRGDSVSRSVAARPCAGGVAEGSTSILVVAPSGPGLAADLVRSVAYREALTTADLVLTDSGFMVLLWRFFSGVTLPRISGLKFMHALLERPELKVPGAVFWVMPSVQEDQHNRAWLVAQGFPVTADDVYIAPHYPAGGIGDAELVRRIEAHRPKVVMLAIGGGAQERLGLMLRAQLNTPSSIVCLGAAIAFLSGGQARIPLWADRLVLGWLLRFWSGPRKFWRRYWDALDLVGILWMNREWLPPLRR